MCVSVSVPQHSKCGCQKSTWWSQFSSNTTWVPGVKRRWSGVAADDFTLWALSLAPSTLVSERRVSLLKRPTCLYPQKCWGCLPPCLTCVWGSVSMHTHVTCVCEGRWVCTHGHSSPVPRLLCADGGSEFRSSCLYSKYCMDWIISLAREQIFHRSRNFPYKKPLLHALPQATPYLISITISWFCRFQYSVWV